MDRKGSSCWGVFLQPSNVFLRPWNGMQPDVVHPNGLNTAHGHFSLALQFINLWMSGILRKNIFMSEFSACKWRGVHPTWNKTKLNTMLCFLLGLGHGGKVLEQNFCGCFARWFQLGKSAGLFFCIEAFDNLSLVQFGSQVFGFFTSGQEFLRAPAAQNSNFQFEAAAADHLCCLWPPLHRHAPGHLTPNWPRSGLWGNGSWGAGKVFKVLISVFHPYGRASSGDLYFDWSIARFLPF